MARAMPALWDGIFPLFSIFIVFLCTEVDQTNIKAKSAAMAVLPNVIGDRLQAHCYKGSARSQGAKIRSALLTTTARSRVPSTGVIYCNILWHKINFNTASAACLFVLLYMQFIKYG